MTCRQLTADEAHKLDHLIDAFLTKGTLVTKPDLVPLVVEAQNFFGSFTALQRYVFEKTQRILNKPVEDYDEGGGMMTRRPRLPFDADFDTVAEDREVLAEYLKHATMPRADERPDSPAYERAVSESIDFKKNRLRRLDERN